MHPLLIAAGSFVTGGLGWTLTEYVMHRWGAHEGRNGLRFQTEHLAHHSIPGYFAPTIHKVQAAVASVSAIGVVGSLAVGPLRGIAFALGFVAVYATYEWIHRRIHTHAPRGPLSAYLRKHHFAHHFVDASSNHGVTSPVWDALFRTRRVPAVVKVPRRLGPDWMFDGDGAIRPEFAGDYRRAGG